uniref:Uncharacterized protein n=1 Tax=Glossina pallidipes TaxID=7398 RepID=A0A1B0AK77_GLOPL
MNYYQLLESTLIQKLTGTNKRIRPRFKEHNFEVIIMLRYLVDKHPIATTVADPPVHGNCNQRAECNGELPTYDEEAYMELPYELTLEASLLSTSSIKFFRRRMYSAAMRKVSTLLSFLLAPGPIPRLPLLTSAIMAFECLNANVALLCTSQLFKLFQLSKGIEIHSHPTATWQDAQLNIFQDLPR